MAKHRSFSSLVNLQSKSINFKFGNLSPKYQGYSLTFWPKIAHFHHFSICNQNQLITNLVSFHQNTKAIALLFAKHRSFSSLFNFQSTPLNFTFGHFSPKYQDYSLTFWPKIAHFHHFSICNQNQSMSTLLICHQNTKAIALLFAKHRSFSSLFNLQSTPINFKFGHFSPKYQDYSLTFWSQIAHFHHFSICNQNQSISNLVIFHQNTKAIALLFGHKSLIFITFQSALKINQFQIWSFFTKIPRL